MTETVRHQIACVGCGRPFLFVGELYTYVATLVRAGWQSDAAARWRCPYCARLAHAGKRR